MPGSKNIRRFALILICAIATVLPYAWRGTTCGHDFDFHLQSWLAAADQWRHGVFYPSWIDGANFGAGEPRFVFYPPVSWMLGALAGTILPWAAAPMAFTLAIMIGYGLAMDSLARDWMPPNAAAVAACSYILSPYALFVAYERTAYGELAAGIWLPFIVRFALRLGRRHPEWDQSSRHQEGNETQRSKVEAPPVQQSLAINIVGLALAIAAVWLSNAPAAVMSCYFLGAIALSTSIARRSFQPVLLSFAGLLFGMALAAFYIVPAAYERHWVDIAHALAPGVRYQEGFLFGRSGDPFHDAVLRQISWVFILMFATVALAAAVAWKRGTPRRILLPILGTAAVLLALQTPWSAPVWKHTPELKFLQFPWRWTLVLSVVFAIALGLAASPRLRQRKSANSFISYAAIVLFAGAPIILRTSKLFWQYCDEEDAISAQVEIFQSGAGYEGTDEYVPLGADNSIVPRALPPVRILKDSTAEIVANPVSDDQANTAYAPEPNNENPSKITVKEWRPERKSLTVTASSGGFAVLRLMDYPAWQVSCNRSIVAHRPRRSDGLMTIPIQPGMTRIEITYTATQDVSWGRGLSVASLFALLTLAAKINLRRRSAALALFR